MCNKGKNGLPHPIQGVYHDNIPLVNDVLLGFVSAEQ